MLVVFPLMHSYLVCSILLQLAVYISLNTAVVPSLLRKFISMPMPVVKAYYCAELPTLRLLTWKAFFKYIIGVLFCRLP